MTHKKRKSDWNYGIDNLYGAAGVVTALQAMLDGLEKYDKSKKFRIDMASFGWSGSSLAGDNSRMCMGCAATCALQFLEGHTFTPHEICVRFRRESALSRPNERLIAEFEDAIDEARKANLKPLFIFCKAKSSFKYEYQYTFMRMNTENWKAAVPGVNKLILKIMEDNDLEWEK
jgi:hypothetical protein